KIYQQFKLSESEARIVQDKIYALEAKAGVAAKKQGEEQEAAAAHQQKKRDYQDKIGFLAGTWNWSGRDTFNGQDAGHSYQVGRVVMTIVGKNIFLSDPNNPKKPATSIGNFGTLKGRIEGDDYSSIKWKYCSYPSPGEVPVNVTVDKSHNKIT